MKNFTLFAFASCLSSCILGSEKKFTPELTWREPILQPTKVFSATASYSSMTIVKQTAWQNPLRQLFLNYFNASEENRPKVFQEIQTHADKAHLPFEYMCGTNPGTFETGQMPHDFAERHNLAQLIKWCEQNSSQ